MQRQIATRCRQSSSKDLSLGAFDWSSKQTSISERTGQSRLTLSDYDTLAKRRPSARRPVAVRWAAQHTAVHSWTTIRRGAWIQGCVASGKCAAHAPRFGSEQGCCGERSELHAARRSRKAFAQPGEQLQWRAALGRAFTSCAESAVETVQRERVRLCGSDHFRTPDFNAHY